MYLIPSNPEVFNIKWDLCATKYAPPSNPVVPASSTAPVAPSVSPALYPASSGIQYRRPTPGPCTACNCSPRGISTPPQKRMGQLGDTAGVPAGTVLGYSATWKQSGWKSLSVGWNDPNGVQSAIQQNLAAQWGIVIDAQQHSTSDLINASGQSGFVLQVHTTSDYGAPGDIQSIIDSAIYGVGQEMPASTIRIVQAVSPSSSNPNATYPASTAAAVAAAQAGLANAQAEGDATSAAQFAAQIQQLTGTNPLGVGASLTSWLSNNWALLAAGGLALVAAKEL